MQPAAEGSVLRAAVRSLFTKELMKILVTGSTGLVGAALTKELKHHGHTVCRLVRPDTRRAALERSDGFDVKWDPSTGELGGAAVGADAVVNLGGASISEGRWTVERKKVLRSSRVEATRALVTALSKMAARPRVLISASAIGYYGNRGDEILKEDTAAGSGFLSEIAKEWEAEAVKAEVLGIRVVLMRTGIVLAKNGGALSKMVTPFRLGLGGRLGSGQQWMSWITLADVVGIVKFCLENGAVRGPINLVSPQPVRNAEFTSALAGVVHRPAIFPAPAFALRLALGEMADALLLSSERVVPVQLGRLGYRFLDPDLPPAIASTLS
jgi:uncharacterized protein